MTKKITAVVLTLIMAFACALPAFAEIAKSDAESLAMTAAAEVFNEKNLNDWEKFGTRVTNVNKLEDCYKITVRAKYQYSCVVIVPFDATEETVLETEYKDDGLFFGILNYFFEIVMYTFMKL